jgi:hypothetical protein
MNSLICKLDKDDDDFNSIEEKNQNMSMFISSSYVSSEIQEIHDGSNMKENEINNTLNILSKKEQALDKSINFQNISVEEEFINKEVFTNLGKDTGIEPIIEKEDDDVNESFYHDKYFIDKFEEKKDNLFEENNINNNFNNNTMINYSTSNEGFVNNYLLDENDKLKIKKNLIHLKLSKNASSFNSTTISTTKENSNTNNKSVLSDNKKIFFNVTKANEDFITDNVKLNLSSCQLSSSKSKKSKRGRKQILLSGVKTEILDKTFLREFKKYLKLKKKEFKNIFEQDIIFWNEFLENKNPPFNYTNEGKKICFKSYNKNLMNFIFSRQGVNTLYTRFILENKDVKFDKIFSKKKIKKSPDYYTIAFYKFYRENLNKLYSQDYSEFEINVDDINLNNVSMDLVTNSFQ